MSIKRIDPSHVWLVSGQVSELKAGSRDGLAPTVEQRVVVAPDPAIAYDVLAGHEPSFKPLGLASLADYERAVTEIRAALSGESLAWPIYRTQ